MSASSPSAARPRVSVGIPNHNGAEWPAAPVQALDLLKHLPQLLYGQLYFLIAYRRPGASLAGYASLLPCIPHVWRERQRARASRRIGVAELDRMLTTRMREPPLRVLLRHRLRRLWS